MDDLIAQFTAVTGASPEQAGQFLQLADNNIEQAVALFFESGPLDLPGSGSAAGAGTSQPTTTYREDRDGVVHIDSDDDDVVETGADRGFPQHNMTDEELARQLAQEDEQQHEVRAPIARTTETLVGPGSSWGGGADADEMSAAVEEQLLRRNQARRNRGERTRLHFATQPLTDLV
jgi:UBX domain-containing protein 7